MRNVVLYVTKLSIFLMDHFSFNDQNYFCFTVTYVFTILQMSAKFPVQKTLACVRPDS